MRSVFFESLLPLRRREVADALSLTSSPRSWPRARGLSRKAASLPIGSGTRYFVPVVEGGAPQWWESSLSTTSGSTGFRRK